LSAPPISEESIDHAAEPAQPSPRTIAHRLAPLIAVVSWLVPGLGHLILRRWGRALIFFATVGGLTIAGYLMHGDIFPPHSEDPFGTIGFLADASTGLFYLLGHFFEPHGGDLSRAAGDYGTRFVATAGLVNLLSVFDAYEIAAGRRQ
jgi:hypothetical protein